MLRWKSLLTIGLPKGVRRKARSRPLLTRRLTVETLEDRRMLAVMTVTDLSDDTLANLAGDSVLSLREAVEAINAGAAVDGIGPTSGTFGVDDRIVFDSTLFIGGAQTITLAAGELQLSRAVTITGPSDAMLTIDANQMSRIFDITANTGDFTFDTLTLIRGRTTGNVLEGRGGAIRSVTSGNLSIIGSTISGNSTTGILAHGGGVYTLSPLTLNNSTVSGNDTTGLFSYGGGVYAVNDITLTNSTVSGNNTATSSNGGGIWGSSGHLTITNSILAGNTAGGGNSDLRPSSGTLTVNFSLIGTGITPSVGDNNILSNDPGLAPLTDNGGTTLTHALLPNSPAINAGDPNFTSPPDFDQRGMGFDRVRNGRIDIGAFEVQDVIASPFIVSTLEDEQTNNGFVSLREAIASANTTAGAQEITFDPSLTSGGAATINIASQLPTITEALTITGPGANLLSIDAGLGGDGLKNGNGYRIFNIDDGTDTDIDVEISGLTLTGGDVGGVSPNSYGGAIFNRENLTLTSNTLSGNSASGNGGAVSNYGTATITQSTLSDNSATGLGGGLHNFMGTVSITQSTLSGNSASESGGGVFNLDGTVMITRSTLSGNSAIENGGGVYNALGTAMITQSIISGNTAATGGEISNVFSTLTLDSFNLIGDNSKSNLQALSGVIGGTSDILATSNGTNPTDLASILTPLADNGGPTQTHALVAGSPAINAGDPSILFDPAEFDQRGTPFVRVKNDRIDIGAIESDFAPVTLATIVSLDGGVLRIRDMSATGNDDDLQISLSSGNIVIMSNQTIDTDIPGSTGTGTMEVRVPLASITANQIDVDTAAGNDRLELDYAGGFFPLDVSFAGGDPTTGPGDSLAITGGTFSSVTHTHTGSDAGNIVLNTGTTGSTITYTGLEPVDMTGSTITDLFFNLPGTADNAILEDDGTSGNGISRIRSQNGTFETTTFTSPTNSLTVNLGSDAATFTVASLPDYSQSLNIEGEAGSDAVVFQGMINLSSTGASLTVINADGGITDAAGTSLLVNGTVTLNAAGGAITLGDNAADTTELGMLSITGGTVSITEETAVSIQSLVATTATLVAGTDITDLTNSSINVAGLATLTAGGLIQLGDNVGDTVNFGSIQAIGTSVSITEDSNMNVAGVTATGNVTLSADDNLSIAAGATIDTDGNDLTFSAGDDFLFAAGASIVNAGNVTVSADLPDEDGGTGSVVSFLGTISATQLTLNGGNDSDTFIVLPSVDTPINVNGGSPTAAPGDRLLVQVANISDAIVPAVPPTSGMVAFFASSHQAITFTSIETLLGGTLVVDNIIDEDDGDFSAGDLSLREAIGIANVSPGPDSISFAAALNGGTILLELGELEITEALTITGLGASLLTIDAQQMSRIFNITATTGDFTFEGLTLTGGRTIGDNVLIGDDSTFNGGAIRSRTTGNLSINESAITGNSTAGNYAFGGGIDAYDVSLTNSTVTGNSTAGAYAFGGGISAANLILTNSIVSDNSTAGEYAFGGGVYAYTVTLSDSTVTDNSTMENVGLGGGIFAFTNVMLTNSTVSGNSTAGESSSGGGIFAYNDVVLIDSTVSGNSTSGANAYGGGLVANNVELRNSTVSGNSTSGANAYGGGVVAFGNVSLTNSTVYDNSTSSAGADGGGIWANDGVVTIGSSIVAGNTAGGSNPDLRPGTGTLTVDYSLIGDTTGTGITILTGMENLLDISAELFPLADNGGPTLTHLPMPTSPIIDAGNPADFAGIDGVPQFDQRGNLFSRVRDGNGDGTSLIDIGATEVENQNNGPQVIGLFVTDDPNYDLFNPAEPTVAVQSITVRMRDLPPRSSAFTAPALDFTFANNKAFYSLIGDSTGIIPILDVQIDQDPTVPGQPATANIRILFATPLADDRFTLTLLDSIQDTLGNRLDGESNAVQPLTPDFPSGDGVPGGDFVARFTIDSRPELGVYGAGQVFIDSNGNYTFDPNNTDASNRDTVLLLGTSSDSIFAGKFVEAATDTAGGFDKLAVYGRAGNQWQWQIDFNGDGIPDLIKNEPLNINGIPVAGNFDGNADNGDEVGVFTGTTWYFDTDHDFQLNSNSAVTIANLSGYPVVGDFDGNGFEDLATYNPSSGNNVFSIATGIASNSWSNVLVTSRVGAQGSATGFAGVRERPIAADMNADGLDDLGLWVPDGPQLVTGQLAQWYFLVSGDNPLTPSTETDIINRFVAGGGFVSFSTAPFGNDLFAQFGNSFMLPVVGNFGFPSASTTNTPQSQTPATLPEIAKPATTQVYIATILPATNPESIGTPSEADSSTREVTERGFTRRKFAGKTSRIVEPTNTVPLPSDLDPSEQEAKPVELASESVAPEQQIALLVESQVTISESAPPKSILDESTEQQATVEQEVLEKSIAVLSKQESVPQHSLPAIPGDESQISTIVERVESPSEKPAEKTSPESTLSRLRTLRSATSRIKSADKMVVAPILGAAPPLAEEVYPASETLEVETVSLGLVDDTNELLLTQESGSDEKEPTRFNARSLFSPLKSRATRFAALAGESITEDTKSGRTPALEEKDTTSAKKPEIIPSVPAIVSEEVTKKIGFQFQVESVISKNSSLISASLELGSSQETRLSLRRFKNTTTEEVYSAKSWSAKTDQTEIESSQLAALDSAFADFSSPSEKVASDLATQWA
ncbi:choice-of-anchor Q domain-containing protein [Bythopirellula polymerisocia]|uniref:Right handed beta helix domain-containing protein n=1 Tax=Bythopirellula polymerisocia TaxID=2528003 RepID=A0A5C6CJF3_9BACT|nr:choice-of-anchor Q domain-containing protein [Bythopirellula polymerisocia]TWU24578.1 hypothetical protein Pla144_34630 [Bythopirellula polymerisocia]